MILEEKLLNLKKEMILDATLVEGMIQKSIQGLLKRDKGLLTTVIEKEEKRSNDYDLTLDELCTNLLAQYEPRAKDLRTVLMIYKIVKDLERMADHAVNIAESGLFLITKPPLKPLIDIPRMAELTTKMVKNSIDSFVREDTVLAKQVCLGDTDIDQLWEQIFRELVTFMIADATSIERALNLIRISHNLERIGDLSTNIAEDVIFMVEGKVIRHHKLDE